MTFLVGCLIATVAVTGEQESVVTGCRGPYANRMVTLEEIETVLQNHTAWLAPDGGRNDERRANLCQANLQGASLAGANLQGAALAEADLQEAHLVGTNLQGAILYEANLQGAILLGTNLQGAHLAGANLQGAFLMEANLQEAYLSRVNLQLAFLHGTNLQQANLSEANLQGASLVGANLQQANLSEANLQGAVYEPNPEKLPNFWTLTHPHNQLEALVFHHSPAELMALREAFKKGGMRTQERQLTYAIEHTKMVQAWDSSWRDPEAEDTRSWLAQLAGKSESLFSYVLFELPSGYGMAPGRALWGLVGLIPIFALPYWMAIKHANNRHGFG